MFTPIPQVVIPLAVLLGPETERGRVVGYLQAGLLLGIVCSRAYAGALAEWSGWRSAYWCSLGILVAVMVLLVRGLPSTSATRVAGGYPRLLRSTVGLLRDRSVAGICLSGAVIGVAFGVFWNTIPFELQATFGFGPAAVGAFGLVAAVSAAASPIAGRLADRYGVRGTQTAVLAAVLLGWLLIAAPPPWPVVVVAAIVIDVGLWSNQVVNQAAVWSQLGWHAVVAAGAGCSVVGLAVFRRFVRSGY